ncbi:hypothetical protein RHMOL_Rhmol02G0185800 [Rhododendron molle]|uniref:Uncharacterized protein n=1 Tax=Rhododendron molle TaxID=49168 RepID=A0ACC0PRF7_RHOML|nr:hypothetical protein RHMOL_Rhmol02G0185800 [Rhododendron molle]
MFIPASHPLVDPWLSCALLGIRDPVHPMFIPASHPLVDPWLSSYCSFIIIQVNHFSIDR